MSASAPHRPGPGEPLLPDTEPGASDSSPARSLAHLAEWVLRCTPGCCGATATATDPTGEVEEPVAATHPDLASLVAVQWEHGQGPILTALESGQPAGSTDLLHDERWPSYRAQALDVGVRSSATLPYRRDEVSVTLTLYSFRPRPLEEAVSGATALLGDLTAAGLVRDRRYRETLAQVEQLDTALRSRPVVDQACGIIMCLLGCTPEAAFALLRQMSQRSNRKLTDLAHGVVRTRGRGIETELRQLRSHTPDR